MKPIIRPGSWYPGTDHSYFDGIQVKQHPIFENENILYKMGQSVAEIRIWIGGAAEDDPFLRDLQAFKENATQPSASKLLLKEMILDQRAFDDDHYEYLGFPDPEKEWPKTKELRVNGTGLQGAVTVEDIVRAMIKVVNRHPECESLAEESLS